MPDTYSLINSLHMNWLRPECVVWEVKKVQLINYAFMNSDNISEIGIGDGYC
jgi:hypothetical protein